MPATLDEAIEQSHSALAAILAGDPSVYQRLFADRENVTLGNPFGPFASGSAKVMSTLANAATRYRAGGDVSFELVAKYVSDTLAVVVEFERGRAKVGGADEIANIAARTTSVFEIVAGEWRLVHRHTDPITTPRESSSVIAR